jgi:hypothetical protein
MKQLKNTYLSKSSFANRSVKIEMKQVDLAVKVDWGSKATADSTHLSLPTKEGAHDL